MARPRKHNFATRPEDSSLLGTRPFKSIEEGDLFRVIAVFGGKVELVEIDFACLRPNEVTQLLRMEKKDARIDEFDQTQGPNPSD